MNYDYIIRMVFTNPENSGKSIRRVASELDMNPGSVYRILKRLHMLPEGAGRKRYGPDTPFDPVLDCDRRKVREPDKLPPASAEKYGFELLDLVQEEIDNLEEFRKSLD